MLLSLVSKRSLEVDSRDAYGFALRPQHVQRYHEYLSIYTEEETERGEKWKNFLDRLDHSPEPCSSEEEFQDTFPAEDGSESGEESAASGEGSRKEKHESELGDEEVQQFEQCTSETVDELSKENELDKDQAHVLEKDSKPVEDDNEQLEPDKEAQVLEKDSKPVKDDNEQLESEEESTASEEGSRNGKHESEPGGEEVKQGGLETVDDLSKESKPDKEAQYLRVKSLEKDSKPVKDDKEQLESEKDKEKEHSDKSEPDEEKQSQSVKQTEDHAHIQQENEPEKPVAEADKCHEKGQQHKKSRSVIEWADIRPCISSIEDMMCTRVKNVMYVKNSRSHHASRINKALSSIGESVGEETDHDSETSAGRSDSIKEENDAQSSSVTPNPFFPWFEELEVLVRLGVPKDLRGEVWQAFVGVKARRVDNYYHDLLAHITNFDESKEHDVQRKWKKQIEKDIPRTFPGHPALNENGRDSLRRILLAYACHNPSVGYCQAMNFFAGLFLLLMPEENAFWTLVGVIDEYFDGYYTEEMIESQVDQLVFEELMRERFPKLVNHLDYLGVQVAWISGPWFLSIFVNILPWECVLRMWDVLLFEGNRVVLFRTAFALMELYGPAIIATQDAGDAITSLQALASSTFDSSQLVLTACMGYLSTNEARLEELRVIHRPAVLEIVEERMQKGRVWKDKKGLASKLYSFKHEGSILGEHTQKEEVIVQAVWLKVELCRLLEEKRSAVLRAEELEIALMEMVKEDNRLELSARIEELEKEVRDLKQALSDKKEQETAMLQVLMKVEQDQKLTEDARVSAEQDAAAQKYAVHVLQEKNEKLAAQLAQMEKRVVTAETTLEATLQYESGQNKALSSPRFAPQETLKKKTGFLSFGLGWRERNKAKEPAETNGDSTSNATSEAKSPEESKSEDLLNPETKR
ncbi:PREDICTED: ecotropic viral integration site 5 protein homolog isoform X2 [Brassica oleracea var. oleracea]|uniref:ecotropic viral integration site 5 protein homolog isoform X2 n=1 Tax=Brassica oleracea var. oleracea TaxID=109376 RepID=UPI0006A71D79|nr:PREDICTED: ecotropic viral integration site 5 protein homolog isoform X2 [Brassica oleracea var. oleracea]